MFCSRISSQNKLSGHSGPTLPTNAKQVIFSKLQYLDEMMQIYKCLPNISTDFKFRVLLLDSSATLTGLSWIIVEAAHCRLACISAAGSKIYNN
jgi:hypothetical protein